MKIFKTSLIAALDKFTTENEPISGIDLMERASSKVVDFIMKSDNIWGDIIFFCGQGNNGGDGLAVARMLTKFDKRFHISVFIVKSTKGFTPSAQTNFERLQKLEIVEIKFIDKEEDIPSLSKKCTIIDALFGSGLSRPLEGLPAKVVDAINKSGQHVVSIDIPSGLMGEDNSLNNRENIIKASKTISFQFPKLAFLLPENDCFVGQWYVVPIGLHKEALDTTESSYFLIDSNYVKDKIVIRPRFSHKGIFGHALLIAGSYGKMGAAILSAKACLRSGAGLLTTHIPHNTYPIMQVALPESMSDIDDSDLMFTSVKDLTPFSAIGVGPAIGTKTNSQRGFKMLLEQAHCPIVIDADGLNILSMNKDWMKLLPANTIITPHPGEFDRLAGHSESGFERLQKAIKMATEYNIIVVLKGAFTAIATPNGNVFFNSTGNPGMATAGSGDTLTGMILGLLSQKYTPLDAAIVGVYLHGLAGDIAAKKRGENGLIASDIIDHIGKAINQLSSINRKNLSDECFLPSLHETE